MLDEEGLPNKAVPLFCMEIPYCHTVICHLCPRGFAIPEEVISGFQSERVTDPLLSTLWIANPQGRKDKSFSVIVSMSSGICNPRGCNCGFQIRAGHRPAI